MGREHQFFTVTVQKVDADLFVSLKWRRDSRTTRSRLSIRSREWMMTPVILLRAESWNVFRVRTSCMRFFS